MLRIKFERQRRNWTQEELSRRARVRQQDISAIECCRLVPSRGIAARLADALGIEAANLLEAVGDHTNQKRIASAEDTRCELVVLRVLRRAKGFTLQRLAERAGISATIIGRIEHGTHKPTERELNALAWALDVSPPEILLQEMHPVPVLLEAAR